MDLTRLKSETVFRRSEAGVLLEQPGEVALIAESGSGRDRAERRVACELAPGELDAQLACVSRAGRLVDTPERSRKMHRVHADLRGDRRQRERLGKLTLDQRPRPLEPGRRGPVGGTRGPPPSLHQDA